MKKLVIKIGSGVLTGNKPGLDRSFMESLAKAVSLLIKKYRLVIVSSGAIAAGLQILRKERKNLSIPEKQAAASCGQAALMSLYRECFAKYNISCAQILLTNEDLSDLKRFRNIRSTIEELTKRNIVPIINENDTVATDEIKVGDNDILSARVALKIRADNLFVVTDVGALYDKNPAKFKDAGEISRVEQITRQMELSCMGSDTAYGTGGMKTKLAAAKMCMASSVGMYIIGKESIGVIDEILKGLVRGTYFVPEKQKISGVKSWLAFCARSKGTIIVDKGAVTALLKGNNSLLPAGVTGVKGSFAILDTVEIVNQKGSRIGLGIVNFSASELLHIKGMKSDKIRLLFPDRKKIEAVHLDDMVLSDN